MCPVSPVHRRRARRRLGAAASQLAAALVALIAPLATRAGPARLTAAGASAPILAAPLAPALAEARPKLGARSADGGEGSVRPALPTEPPPDGMTRWAPAPSDESWADVRRYGAVGNAVVDDTVAFRRASATGKKLFVPKPLVAYKLTGFIHLQNSMYGDGSMPEIRMYGADGDPKQTHDHVILFVDGYDGPGLVISGLHLDGQWDGVSKRGEYSHGVQIRGSRNVIVQNNLIERAYGDCVCIVSYTSTMPDHITVRDNKLVGPRRCNVAVVGGTHVVIAGNYLEKNNDYVAAVDLETDPLGYQYIRDVTVEGNVVNAVRMQGGGGAFSALNPIGNPRSSDVTFTNNTGRWAPCTPAIALPGSNGLVSMLTKPPLSYGQPWSNVTASANVQGSIAWSFRAVSEPARARRAPLP